MIEAATGLLFLTIWVRVYNKLWPHSVVLAFSVLVSVLIAVTLIDIRHRIIPNQLVFAGLLSGLIIGIVFPEVHSYSQMGITNYYLPVYKPISYYFFEHATQLIPGSRQAYSILFAFGDSLLGVIFGGGILLTTLELGKLVCGKRKVTLSEPATLTLTTRGFSANDLDFRAWEDLFPRESDKLIVTGSIVEFNFPPDFSSVELDFPGGMQSVEVIVDHKNIYIDSQTIPLQSVTKFVMKADGWLEPQEVMGMGDVKLMALIGLYLGPSAALLIVFLSSLAGTVFGVLSNLSALIFATGKWRFSLPYGPFIALACLMYMHFGLEFLLYVNSAANSFIAQQ